jgi:hypothetical protein
MSFAELKKEVLRMNDSQREKLMRLLLGVRSQNSDKWFAEMERRKREMKAGKKISREEAMRMLGITEKDLAAAR